MKIKLTMKERDLVAKALYRMVEEQGADPKLVYRAGRILETLKDDDREKYYTELVREFSVKRAEWLRIQGDYLAGRSEISPGTEPRIDPTRYEGPEEEFTLLDSDYKTIQQALGKSGWWMSVDPQTKTIQHENMMACKKLMDKFGLGED
jgi:hypothetical protein